MSLLTVLCLLLAAAALAQGLDRSYAKHNEDQDREYGGPLTIDDFLDTDFIVQQYHAVLEDIFAQEPDTQARAVTALRYLIDPMVSPGKFKLSQTPPAGMYFDDYFTELVANQPVNLVDRLDADAVSAMAEAAFTLGVLQSTGVVPTVQKDDKKAAALYALAASHNSVSGNLAMAHRYEQGFGVPKSCSLAYHHLKTAALAFADEAHTDGTFPQKPRPVLLRERARDASFISDAELLFGSADQVDLEYELADRGDPEAVSRVALRQLMGLGVDADVGGAVRAFEAAAAAGDPMGMLTLGLVHTNGVGVEANHTRARELFERAASRQLPAAYNALGHLHLNGLGVPPNATAARALFEVGARLGDPDSMFNLALLHMYGLPDVPANTSRAFELLQAAHREAQWKAPLLLAELYQEHPAVPGGQDCAKALEHLWVFVGERGDFSELSMDALEMATGVPQPGGSAMGRQADGGARSPHPMPHDPRRALLLYVMMAEQGCLTAGMNAAWLLERSSFEGIGGSRDELIQYLYLRAALADYPAAVVDFANWLLRQQARSSASEELEPVSAQRVQGRAGARGGAPGSSPRPRAGPDAWSPLLRLGIAEPGLPGPVPAAEQARLLYAHAEKLRDPEAATNLGWMYMAGVGAQRNLTMAQERYQAALELAGSEAERLAPRVALVCVRAWMLVDRLLPSAVAEVAYAAVGWGLHYSALVFWVLVGHLEATVMAVRGWLQLPQPHLDLL